MNVIIKRILIIIISLVCVFIFPWWLLLTLSIIVAVFIPLYLEMIVMGYWLDILYGLDGDKTMTIVFLISFLIVLYIKKNLLFK